MSKTPVAASVKIRSAVRATGIAIIVIAGSWWGAGLRTNQDNQKEMKRILEAPLEEKVAVLEAQKQHLYSQQALLQQKLDIFHANVREREAAAARKREATAQESANR
ncbi:unnamed protein product [Parascedosporium putredinis]|uniref:Uncharacterized protein n=1 Tax=Parascedosporium putredinis TaxID=1442378 RepID=A0A9P1H917_9PEZI|nr:unnamed protein product [Parascedosporium putredinis]CAI8001380.1 unnamed protein product [Parascedosporium putredinis]